MSCTEANLSQRCCNSKLKHYTVLEEIIMIVSQTTYNTTHLQSRCTKLTFRQLAAILILDWVKEQRMAIGDTIINLTYHPIKLNHNAPANEASEVKEGQKTYGMSSFLIAVANP